MKNTSKSNRFKFKLDWYEFKKNGLPSNYKPILDRNEIKLGLSIMMAHPIDCYCVAQDYTCETIGSSCIYDNVESY